MDGFSKCNNSTVDATAKPPINTSKNGNHGASCWSMTKTPTVSAIRIAPIQSRVCSMPSSLQAAEAAHALAEVAQRLLQSRTVEIGPTFFRDPQLSITDLP